MPRGRCGSSGRTSTSDDGARLVVELVRVTLGIGRQVGSREGLEAKDEAAGPNQALAEQQPLTKVEGRAR